MKIIGLYSLFFMFASLFCTFDVRAQNGEPPRERQAFSQQDRPNLLKELGLSRDQIQQLRKINLELQPRNREAQRALRDANRALDEAIYADNADDSLIQERVKAVQTAQSAVIRNRAEMETSVRKLLTADQLSKFRDLRRRSMQKPGDLEGPPRGQPPPRNDQPIRKRLRQISKKPIT